MAKVNPPIAALSQLNLGSTEGKRALIDILNQLWLKLGGGDDFLANLSFTVDAEDSRKFTELRQLTKRLNQLEMRIEELRQENSLLRKQLAPKQQEEINIQPLIKDLQSRLKHLELQ